MRIQPDAALQRMVAQAGKLRARFRAESREADRLTRIPDAVFTDVQNSGILDAFLPDQRDGLEVPMLTYQDMMVELSQGDGGMAWAVNLLAQGPWMLKSAFSGEAVAEVLGTSGRARIAQMVIPTTCRARREPGGIFISEGEWRFNSGVYHADWDILGVTLGESPPQRVLVVLPISQIEILGDWDTIGLRGSGSSSVRVRDTFVPEHRVTTGFAESRQARGSGVPGDEYWMYRAEFVPVASNILTLPIIGMARAVLEARIEKTHGRSIPYTTYSDEAKAPVTHLQVGQASAEIDAADRLVSSGLARVETATRTGETLSVEERLRMRRDTGLANHLLWSAVNGLVDGAGGAFASSANLLNRFWRDTRVATLHAGLNSRAALEAYGRLRCGQDPGTNLY